MTLREQITKAAFRFIARQLLVVVIAAGLLAAVFGFAGFCAALVGGLICGVVPNLLATVMVYYKQTYQRPSRMLLRFLLAELVKISLSAGLFFGRSVKCARNTHNSHVYRFSGGAILCMVISADGATANNGGRACKLKSQVHNILSTI